MSFQGIDMRDGVRVIESDRDASLRGAELTAVRDATTLRTAIAAKMGRVPSVTLDYHKTPNGTVYVASGPQDQGVWDEIDAREITRG